MSVSAPAITAPAPARVRPTVVTRMMIALGGLLVLLAGMSALSVWRVVQAEAELLRAEQGLVQLENARAIEAAFNSHLLGGIDRRLRGGGDPAELREAGRCAARS